MKVREIIDIVVGLFRETEVKPILIVITKVNRLFNVYSSASEARSAELIEFTISSRQKRAQYVDRAWILASCKVAALIFTWKYPGPASSSGASFFAWQRRARNASDRWWTARDHGKGANGRRSRLPLRAHRRETAGYEANPGRWNALTRSLVQLWCGVRLELVGISTLDPLSGQEKWRHLAGGRFGFIALYL